MDNIEKLKSDLNKYLESCSLSKDESTMVKILSSLLEFFYFVVKLNESKKNMFIKDSILNEANNKISEITKNLLNFLGQNYNKEETYNLEVDFFDKTSEFISLLIKNFFYYFSNYQFESKLLNIHYYLCHLIYFILSIIISNSKKIDIFDDLDIKFYIFHIINFFKNERHSQEYDHIFYLGAFKFLNKKYKIEIKYIIQFEKDINPDNQFIKDIKNTIKIFLNKLYKKKNKSENEDNFLNKSDQIEVDINLLLKEDNGYYDHFDIVEKSKKVPEAVNKVKDYINKYNIKCKVLDEYYEDIKKFNDIILKNNLTDVHFYLMWYDSRIEVFQGKIYLEKLKYLLSIWQKNEQILNQDYTNILYKIINSKNFQKLYSIAMNSGYIKKFIDNNELTDEYNIFLKKYAPEINKYILLYPLKMKTRSYLSNFLRIIINIHNIDLNNKLEESVKEELLKSFLLIQLLFESINFIIKLILLEKKTKKMTKYKDIEKYLIKHLFNSYSINFISIENTKIINDIKSWENNNTDFNIFKNKNKHNQGLKFYYEDDYDDSASYFIYSNPEPNPNSIHWPWKILY